MRTPYEFQRGGDHMLVLDCAARGPLPPLPGPRETDPVRWRHLVPTERPRGR
ncbi:hypothetical protein ACFONH_25930 [Streptomonospora nanhaiensis]|uniref:Uncharacterized protein n=1 Tax=Streptomonospora nanhaiensis TaxID=1323731 RepID=A0A853BW34_9ACTN|nr:hypothetical protein [Streptomonospora nanhaiensis]MBV2364462.1 hypothetical protein [Streptomonospora nanhaiensis]MBX9391199.1 hypothetical protein [Streptomonospora nanhaiensis]NYI99190.1 hypothetical protein [Streptomonospora nanhaiensis]